MKVQIDLFSSHQTALKTFEQRLLRRSVVHLAPHLDKGRTLHSNSWNLGRTSREEKTLSRLFDSRNSQASGKSSMCISQQVEVAIQGCENLSHWINRLKAKEAILKSSHKNRDLRREVLLNHAAQKAQEQLSHQQLLNRQRWTDFKARDLQQCKICLATPNFCTCTSNELSEESRKFDDFFASLSVNSKKRKKPTILRSNDCKRIKV